MGIIAPTPLRERLPGPHPRGRRCAEPGCPTILHTRHDGDHCYVHAQPEPCAHSDHQDAFTELLDLPDQAA